MGTSLQLSLAPQRIHDGRSRSAVSVVRDQQSVGGMRVISRRQIKLARQVSIGCFLRFAVHPHHLLARGVRHSCENARLGHRGIALVFQDAADREFFYGGNISAAACQLRRRQRCRPGGRSRRDRRDCWRHWLRRPAGPCARGASGSAPEPRARRARSRRRRTRRPPGRPTPLR